MSIITRIPYPLEEKADSTAAMKRRYIEVDPEVKVVLTAGIRLRYIEIDPEVIDELPDWSQADIERESELTLRDLGVSPQPHESYLNAWVQTMLSENGCEDNAENRKRLVAAVRQDRGALLFVWVLGGKERKIFGLDDSPQLEWYRAKRAADRALMAAFAQAGEPHQGNAHDRNASELGIHWPYILAWSLLALAMLAEGWIVSGVLFVASFMTLLAAYVRAEAIRGRLLAGAHPDGDEKWLFTNVLLRGEDFLKVVAFGAVLVSVCLGGLGWSLMWIERALPPGADWFFGIVLAVGIGLVLLMGRGVLHLIGWIRRALKK